MPWQERLKGENLSPCQLLLFSFSKIGTKFKLPQSAGTSRIWSSYGDLPQQSFTPLLNLWMYTSLSIFITFLVFFLLFPSKACRGRYRYQKQWSGLNGPLEDNRERIYVSFLSKKTSRWQAWKSVFFCLNTELPQEEGNTSFIRKFSTVRVILELANKIIARNLFYIT